METGSIRKWHIGIGLPLFTGILIWSYLSMDPMGATGRTTSPMTFEMAARSRPIGKANPHPQVWDVKLYPPEEGVWTVTFMQLTPKQGADAFEATPWSFAARNPRNGSSETIPEWLARLKTDMTRQNQPFDYSYAWWREPGRLWMIWAVVSGLLVIWGVVVPLGMWVARGGYKEFTEKGPEAAGPDAGMTAAGRAVVTDADHDKLDEMIDRLETTTAGSEMGGGAGGGAQKAGQPGAPKVLAGGPLEASSVPVKDEGPKDYAGEYYPVAKAGHAHGPGHDEGKK